MQDSDVCRSLPNVYNQLNQKTNTWWERNVAINDYNAICDSPDRTAGPARRPKHRRAAGPNASPASRGSGRAGRGSSPDIPPTFVARASRRRCGWPHGPKERLRAAEGVVDTGAYALSKRLEGARPVTAHGSAPASQEAGEISGLAPLVKSYALAAPAPLKLGATEDRRIRTRIVVPLPTPSLNGSMLPPEERTKFAEECRPSPLPFSLEV